MTTEQPPKSEGAVWPDKPADGKCQRCKQVKPLIKPYVPWGRWSCNECRKHTVCICGVPQDDCSC